MLTAHEQKTEPWEIDPTLCWGYAALFKDSWAQNFYSFEPATATHLHNTRAIKRQVYHDHFHGTPKDRAGMCRETHILHLP